MAKNVIGIDIGHDQLKIAQVQGRSVKKTAVVPLKEKMISQGHVVSVESLADVIRHAMKKNGIHGSLAAVVLPGDCCFVRNVTMTIMTADQLAYNLPYEFRDYIPNELERYVFDYAMITGPEELRKRAEEKMNKEQEEEAGEEEDSEAGTMDLTAAAVSAELLDELRRVMRKAGLRLWKAAPAISAYINLLRGAGSWHDDCCIVDLGYNSTRMDMFSDDRYRVTRELERGLSVLIQMIADEREIDLKQAKNYLMTNQDNCQYSDICRDAYSRISVEMMRAVNFYQFSNTDSNLQSVYLCGGGALIEPLQEEIRRMLSLQVCTADELYGTSSKIPMGELMIPAVGIAMN